MFILVTISEEVGVPPKNFNVTTNQAIEDALNEKFSNKVIRNTGLGICVFDLINIEDSYIYPGEGTSHTKVEFRLLVFRPFVGEIITGIIRSCSPEGINVSLRSAQATKQTDFFSDVFIPSSNMPDNCFFDEEDKQWVWPFHDQATDHRERLVLELDCEVRLRVVEVSFHVDRGLGPPRLGLPKPSKPENGSSASLAAAVSVTPAPASATAVTCVPTGSAAQGAGSNTAEKGKEPPMVVIGAINEDGLGLIDWWGEQ
eukprot:Rmarinus@m.8673